jgi:hypothetical protein
VLTICPVAERNRPRSVPQTQRSCSYLNLHESGDLWRGADGVLCRGALAAYHAALGGYRGPKGFYFGRKMGEEAGTGGVLCGESAAGFDP